MYLDGDYTGDWAAMGGRVQDCSVILVLVTTRIFHKNLITQERLWRETLSRGVIQLLAAEPLLPGEEDA